MVPWDVDWINLDIMVDMGNDGINGIKSGFVLGVPWDFSAGSNG